MRVPILLLPGLAWCSQYHDRVDSTCPLVLSDFDYEKLYKGSSNFFSQIENFFADFEKHKRIPNENVLHPPK